MDGCLYCRSGFIFILNSQKKNVPVAQVCSKNKRFLMERLANMNQKKGKLRDR
jgi:hypothetical protein